MITWRASRSYLDNEVAAADAATTGTG